MEFNQILKKTKNHQLAYYIQAAIKLDIDWEIVIPSIVVEFQKKDLIWKQFKAISPLNNSASSTLSMYKNLCSNFLRKKDFRIPLQQSVKNVNEIKPFMEKNKLEDIVIKPIRGVGGMGVTILPKTDKELEDGFNLANKKSFSKEKTNVVVEEFIKGNNYRLLVLGDKVIAAVLREPAKVIGDGKSSIRLLITQNNTDMKDLGLAPIKIDDEARKVLSSQNLTLESIPKDGETVYLRINCNLSSGGTTTEYLSKVNKHFKKIAVDATKATGLVLSGVDLITTDITDPNSKYAINEINHNPGLRPHYLPDKGKPFDVAFEIQKYILNYYERINNES
jgi:glutamate--cysteine ligase